ncbi:MAG: hypothetical protein IPP83_04490 [Flavobacteriales bacterium]|nr:hypothetical protein [Flavobacteriales bacterium]
MRPRTDRSSRSVEVIVRTLLTLLLFSGSVHLVAQDRVQIAFGHVKALINAKTDAQRDSVNELLKATLRVVLDAPDGMTVNLDDLPLSRVDAPDGRFRLITWNIPRENGTYRYEGFVLGQAGRKSSLFELRDMTSGIPSPELAELGPDRWFGALYYQVIPAKKGGRTYYTLLGWKGQSNSETQKVIEVLSFRGDKPRFGAPVFGGGKLKQYRRTFAFAYQSTMMLHYEAEQQRIVLDHLAAARADMEGKPAFMGPDMSFDAFVWNKGEWTYQRDIDLRDPKRDGRPFNAPPKEPRK